jgi:hypothetical protein
MRESVAQAVLLVRAFEEADPEGKVLPLDDRRAATEAARAEAAGRGDAAVVEARARRLFATLDERVPGLPRLLGNTRVLGGLAPVVVAVGLGAGLLVNELGRGPHVQLLPMLFALGGLLLWNLAMYVVFGTGALRRQAPAPAGPIDEGAPGRLTGAAAWVLEWTVGRFSRSAARRKVREVGVVTAAVTRFAASWRRAVAPLLASRARLAFHLGSLSLALGIVAGMVFRGVVRKYDVAWDSTFLDADGVHALVRALLGPAGALTGHGAPSLADVAACKAPLHASARSWILLYGVTVAAFVVVPRLLLALAERAHAARLARDLPIDLGPVYAARAGGAGVMPGARVEVVPYSHTPPPRAAEALKALLHDVFGTRAEVTVLPSVPYGAELEEVPAVSGGPVCRVWLLSTAQTPETEVHGRLLAELASKTRASDRLVVVTDASAYRERLADAARVEERGRLWERIAREAGVVVVPLDLGAGGRDGGDRGAAARLAAAVGGAAVGGADGGRA